MCDACVDLLHYIGVSSVSWITVSLSLPNSSQHTHQCSPSHHVATLFYTSGMAESDYICSRVTIVIYQLTQEVAAILLHACTTQGMMLPNPK